MQNKILKMLGRADYVPTDLTGLIRLLRLRPAQQQELQGTLRSLERDGRILRTKGDRYIVARDADLIAGVISINRQGKGFLQPEESGAQEIVIRESATSTALNGDRVLVRRDPPAVRRKPEDVTEITGAVVRILERKRTEFVGTLQRGRQFYYVVPDDPRIPHDIYVPTPRDVGGKVNAGDKVVVEILAWDSRHTNPEGEVIEVLGPPDQEGVDMLSVIRNYDLPLRFPKAVLREADAIVKKRSLESAAPEDLVGRIDCRGHDVITIDPDDARDFDDAICIKRQGAERWVVWVHIADVSHYVTPGSALDTEARARGNSTYLVDRVIPMLPEALSNELCSLKPGVDRLTKCAEFLLTNEGEVVQSKFYPSVIRSKRRFTYAEVLSLLGQDPKEEIERMLHSAHEMAQRIRRARFAAGSLDMDFPENKIRLDAQGRVTRIDHLENDVSHQLIEEYMLLANEAVAARLMHLRRPSIYRVHEAPKAKRLADYREMVLSHRIPCGNLSRRVEVQRLLERLGGAAVGPALKIGFLRSMMRARYAVEPLGHYGLNKTRYTHFTSPIRRYADLIVHRTLFAKNQIATPALEEAAKHISDTERTSSDAERDSKDVKLFAYLQEQIESGNPQTYPALVTDLRNFGFFVDVPGLGLSGLVPLSAVQDDFFIYEPEKNQLYGRNSRRSIRIGDTVPVQPHHVDTFKKQINFKLAPSPRSTPKAAKSRTESPPPDRSRLRKAGTQRAATE